MTAAPYLIALALLEQGGQRAMPLQGKSLPEPVPADGDPGDVGRQQALELLVRVWQRSEGGALRRAAGEHSLLLLELPIEALQETLPAIKARWIATGDNMALLQQLRELAGGLWTLGLERREPLCFRRLQ
ncbi:hypothetical protein [Synechococcus sp. CS-205]|jgi:hypothetical protein|uniref:hypothetical protein n=1 Tax=Synechococcus sp. CS-205 TaxID=2847984 RepID=UPI00223B9993|nr:hypothetical protein [Synechococcus sp. CS-205]MCT0248572.1 hypothetical protein [Synechococcus sp. CS-205]